MVSFYRGYSPRGYVRADVSRFEANAEHAIERIQTGKRSRKPEIIHPASTSFLSSLLTRSVRAKISYIEVE